MADGFNAHWDINVAGIMVALETTVRRTAERATQRIYDGVVERSPVYTGQFRASWNMSQGAPDYSTVDHGGSPEAPIPAPRKQVKSTLGGPYVFFVTNGKPYAERLEEGSSSQAPNGIMRATLASLR